MGTTTDRAIDGERALLGKIIERAPQGVEWNVLPAGSMTLREFIWITHIQQIIVRKLRAFPMENRIITAQVIRGNHPSEIDCIFGGAKLGCITEFRFFEIVNRRALLDCHGDDVDSLVHPGLAHCLSSEQ